jgi:sterol desaturase/sphingolipid hydroxylase (fatty acid hydroxylase superfamily)
VHPGEAIIGSPAFLLTAVVAGIYVPGLLFSFVDVVVARRLTLKECWSVYWRAMKWYSTFYIAAIAVFIMVPLPPLLDVPAQAPSLSEFFLDLVLYFLLGDFVSYVWHRIEHAQGWYMKHVHYYHHIDKSPLTVWTAMVVHPVEGLSVFLCFYIYGIVFPIYPFTFAVARGSGDLADT